MDQLVAELREALPDIDEDGARTAEIAKALGFGETTVRKLLTG
jgi:DNA-directed RNA polymerase specialized sigma24 family protein